MSEIEREHLWDSEDTREFLKLPTVRTLDQWAYLGRGPAYIKVGRHRRYRRADVEAWLEARTVAPSSGQAQ